MPKYYPKFYFYDGPWENSDSPSVVMEDPEGGDWIVLATLRVVHRPDDLHDMCTRASEVEQLRATVVELANASQHEATSRLRMMAREALALSSQHQRSPDNG